MKKDFIKYKENKKPFSLWDVVVLGVVLVLVVVLLLVIFLPKNQPSECKIYREGKLYRTISLVNKDEPEIITFSGMRVYIKKDCVKVLESDCEDKCCVLIGEIHKKGESIVCVPNQVTIVLE